MWHQPWRGGGILILSPTSGDVTLAEQASQMKLVDFACKLILPISITAIVSMAIAHFFWQRYIDRKENISHEMVEAKDIEINAPSQPVRHFAAHADHWCADF